MKRFRGIVCPIEKPSRRNPVGSHGRKCVVSPACADSMRKLVGKPVKYSHAASHRKGFVAGVILAIYVREGTVVAEGMFDETFLRRRPKVTLGLSFQGGNITVQYKRGNILRLMAGDFHSLLVGPRSKVAFGADTSFELLS